MRSDAAIAVFLVMAGLSAGLICLVEPMVPGEAAPAEKRPASDKRLLVFALLFPLLCSATNSLGYYFDAADLSGVLDPAFTRLFYAVGLIAAGIINDKNRRYGAIACLTALLFPFVGLALRGEVGLSVFLSIFGNIFYGFFSVYRVVLFADLAGRRRGLLPLAVFGLLTGRLGDAAGTLGGVLLGESQTVLTLVTAFAFAVCVPVFFAVYHRIYVPRLSGQEQREAMLNAFEARYRFTSRQSEIFRLVINGASNAEISAELFLSESTVKFHMTNILSRTQCANRTELLTLFKSDCQ